MCSHVLAVGNVLELEGYDLESMTASIRERRKPGRPKAKGKALERDDIPQDGDIVDATLARAPETADEEAAAQEAAEAEARELESLSEDDEDEDLELVKLVSVRAPSARLATFMLEPTLP